MQLTCLNISGRNVPRNFDLYLLSEETLSSQIHSFKATHEETIYIDESTQAIAYTSFKLNALMYILYRGG